MEAPLSHIGFIQRTAVSIGAAVLIAGAIAPGAGAAALVDDDAASGWTSSGGRSSLNVVQAKGAAGGNAAPCSDRAYSLIGGRWTRSVHWSFNSSTVPSGLNVAGVEAVIRKSFSNITGASNDCGRADMVSAQHVYDGRTARLPNISRRVMCTRSDGKNVVAFGRLPAGVLAVTCTNIGRGVIHEADMLINIRYDWSVSVSKCFRQELLEPTITHEVGHVFGLGHVGERRHPLLTMSTASDGSCSNDASTLGLGDMLGLESLY